MRPKRTEEYIKRKREEAKLAIEMKNPPHNMALRDIATELGYNHPQSIVLLIKNYGDDTDGEA